MGKFGLIIILVLAAVLLATGLIHRHAGYKICPGCTPHEYFKRGLKYSCSKDKDHRLTALRFIKKAAEKGEFQAELLLAELYLQKFPNGYVPVFQKQIDCLSREAGPDKALATAYYEKVIKKIEKQKTVPPNLFFNIYLLYSQGILPAEKPAEVQQKWLAKAAEAGSHSAMILLAEAAEARGDFTLAKKWFEAAAQDPADWESALKVGDYYFYGKGVPVDYVQAEKWYQKALKAVQKLASTLESDHEKTGIKVAPKVRLDILRKRLSTQKENASGLEYRLEGTVREFLVYVKGPSKKFDLAGKVINKDGKITAQMNSKLKYASPPEAMEKTGFSSMVDGVKWVLGTFSAHMTKDDK